MKAIPGMSAPLSVDRTCATALTGQSGTVAGSPPAAAFAWQCPVCRGAIESPNPGVVCPACFEAFPLIDGVHRFLPRRREATFAEFLMGYSRVRSAEGWGSDDSAYYLALPMVPAADRSARIWGTRRTSFRLFLENVLRPAERAAGRRLLVLDLGAGNGWLSHQLARRGHLIAAIDVAVDKRDGLGATEHFRMADPGKIGTEFVAIQAEFDRLPFQGEQVDLVVFNGSLHYSTEYEETLAEARRVLRPGGVLAVLDTPYYSTAAAGVAMLRERDAKFRQLYGISPALRPAEGFLDGDRFNALRETTGFAWQTIESVALPRRAARRVITTLRGHREPARFPVIVGHRNGSRGIDPSLSARKSPLRMALARFGLRWQYRIFFQARQHRLVIETVAGYRLEVAPSVFNPVVFRSGKFLAECLSPALAPPGSAVLDLGTGSGPGAVVVAAWASRVVAVDLNPEAVRCARSNVDRLGLTARVDVRAGDLFSPVAGETFDVVLFNPPFYRGAPRDTFDQAWHSLDVVELFSTQLGYHLNPGGRALVLLSTDGETPTFLKRFAKTGWRVRPVSIRHFANESFTLYRLTQASEDGHDRSV